jgi:N-acyl-D-amino-acid deacylase
MILFMTFIRQPDITRLIDDGQYLNFKNLFRILFNFKTFLLLNPIMKGLFMRFFFFILPVLIIIGCNQKPEYDVIIHNGTIYDGSGEKPYIGDIAINGDTIAAVGDLSSANGTTEIEASGMAVSPGFINMLSWANVSLIHDGKSQSDIRQGVTLEVMGEGWSMGPLNDKMKEEEKELQGDIKFDIEWTTLGEYLEYLERKGVSCNVASFIGAGTVRINVLGYEDRAPNKEELERL